ncbi:MAG: DUF4198 domain-containing protein [Planctomycetota bacterium]|nr:DUF4198 domain-containing protein [Planctomycetota bacterium]
MILKTSLAILVLATTLAAHDFWIEPSSFRPSVDARVDVQLVVGEHFSGEFVARKESRILSFAAFDPAGRDVKVIGIEGRTPAGLWKAGTPGLHVLGYQSNGTAIELEADKFERYLVEEGLEAVVAERKTRGESTAKGLELYARCAKSLVVAQAEKEIPAEAWAGWDRVLGYPLELVPTVNPCQLARDADLTVRLLFRGVPLGNALVGCTPKQDPSQAVRLRTDAEGRVTFRPKLGGAHLLRVVHMTRAAPDAAHQWESQWASLTFELPPR